MATELWSTESRNDDGVVVRTVTYDDESTLVYHNDELVDVGEAEAKIVEVPVVEAVEAPAEEAAEPAAEVEVEEPAEEETPKPRAVHHRKPKAE
jgi:hypothetical protein